MNTPNIKDAILFPTMKPEDGGAKKKKENEIAVVVLNKEAGLENWQRMNTVAHLSASFAARTGKSLLFQDTIQTADAKDIYLNIQHAIMIKEVDTEKDIKAILESARNTEGSSIKISEFTREMIKTTNDKKVIAETKEKSHADIEHLGVLVFGAKSVVDEITKKAVLAG